MPRRFLLALLVVLSACGGGGPPLDATGEEIYQSVCARCHRSDLTGGVGPALVAGSPSSERPREYFTQTITRGLGRMPGFGSTLNDEQVERTIDYVFEQQGR